MNGTSQSYGTSSVLLAAARRASRARPTRTRHQFAATPILCPWSVGQNAKAHTRHILCGLNDPAAELLSAAQGGSNVFDLNKEQDLVHSRPGED